jgi:hypothetical protein
VLIPRNRTGRDANPARSAFLAQELIQILIVHAQPIANCERARRFVSFPDLFHIRKNDLDYKDFVALSHRSSFEDLNVRHPTRDPAEGKKYRVRIG